ncbi:sugar ABC transporter permease [Desertihabitans brevis]|uniref:Sugar ABC transporter permease n=1 Tax=Desertihabitans brevis TaxID=2268447 RepID=A0A367YQG8_9ACTN|nr:sugar ABC transporter permease [Desertihabitans brevis]RCK68133.1 sugar ABC transporter permease [Desertihabitans brevis]
MASTSSAATLPTRVGAEDAPRRRGALVRYWPQYVAIAPFYVLFLVFGLFPVAYSFYLSFTEWDGASDITFVGLAQYQYLLGDARFWNAVGNTLIIWVGSTVPMLFFALLIAFLLHQNIRFKGAYRIAFFLPNVTSMVAMAIVFGSVFSDSFGLANGLLRGIGLPEVGWLTEGWSIKLTLIIMVIWRWTGYNAIIYLAGLQAIPTELYDAAKVDGASTWRQFVSITVPMLRPVILFTVITSTIGGLSLFTEPQVLLANAGGNENSGGPGEAGMTIVLYQYNQAFTQFDFGYASAIAWALFVLASVFAIINWRLVRDREGLVERRRRRGGEAR